MPILKSWIIFSTECIYSPNAYRGFAREFLKDLERIRPSAILDIIYAGENFHMSVNNKAQDHPKRQKLGKCERCGYISSQKVCKACVLLDSLNRGRPRVAICETNNDQTETVFVQKST